MWCFSITGIEKCHEGLYSGTTGGGDSWALANSTEAYFTELLNWACPGGLYTHMESCGGKKHDTAITCYINDDFHLVNVNALCISSLNTDTAWKILYFPIFLVMPVIEIVLLQHNKKL